jgi:hypothetical protein
MANRPAPELLGYTTWYENGHYHARFKAHLPQAALAAGCVEEVTAPTERALEMAATRNRVRITIWLTGQWAKLQEVQERRATRGRS